MKGKKSHETAKGLVVKSGNIVLDIKLYPTATAEKIWEMAPFSSHANRWGDEVYFSVPLSLSLEEDARDVLEKGEVGYWPPGKAIAILFGPTPASLKDECRTASPVNVFGKIEEKLDLLKEIKDGDNIEVERIC